MSEDLLRGRKTRILEEPAAIGMAKLVQVESRDPGTRRSTADFVLSTRAICFIVLLCIFACGAADAGGSVPPGRCAMRAVPLLVEVLSVASTGANRPTHMKRKRILVPVAHRPAGDGDAGSANR